MKSSVSAFQDFLAKHRLSIPYGHVVLGSGYGAALEHFPWERVADLPFSEIPEFSSSTVADHAGAYRFYRKGSTTLCFQMGRIHGYEGYEASSVVKTVMTPRLAGVKNFVLTNAAGGLNLAMRPGDVMLIRDHVNLTGQNPLVGNNPIDLSGLPLGPRFPDLARLYDRQWRSRLFGHCHTQGLDTHEGIYLGLLGPSFETPAEVQLFSSWGLHAVGMSTVWEAIALCHSGARLVGLSLISNLASGLAEGTLNHETILETCRASALKIVNAILASIEEELPR
jgi:purine-nucleoside phosphorylase